MTRGTVPYRDEFHLAEKTFTALVWAVAAFAMVSLGGMAFHIPDPEAPVSLLSSSNPAIFVLAALVLCTFIAAISATVTGHLLPDAGIFCAALSLGIYAHFGDSASAFYGGTVTASAQRALGLRFLGEQVLWLLLLAPAWVASTLASASLIRPPKKAVAEKELNRLDPVLMLADSPWVGPLPIIRTENFTQKKQALSHFLTAGGIAIGAWIVLSLDSGERIVNPKQAAFVPGAAAFLAAYLGYKFTPVRSALYAMLASLAVVLAGTVVGALGAVGRSTTLPNVTGWPFLRALPLQMIAWTVVGSLLGFWSAYKPQSPFRPVDVQKSSNPKEQAKRDPVRKKTRKKK